MCVIGNSRGSFRLRLARPSLVMIWAIGVLSPLSPARSADRDNCLLCHQFRGLSRYDEATDRVHVFFVDPDYVHLLEGPHARLACTDCHERNQVATVPHAPVSPVDCTQTCHLRESSGIERQFSHANIAEMLRRSVHPPDVLSQLRFSKGSMLGEGQSSCLYCHDEPVFRTAEHELPKLSMLADRTFHRCLSCHAQQLDIDIAYYLRHVLSRLQPARPTLELAQVCAVCHSDPLLLREHLPSDAVASYVRSFHGKAALLGDESTAHCLSCHAAGTRNVHELLGKNNPDSPVHPTRVADSCSTVECHPAAAPSFGATAVHLDLPTARGTLEFLVAAAFILITAVTFGPSALLAILDLFQSVMGRKHRGDERIVKLTRRLLDDPAGRRRLIRFTVPQRIQHWVLAMLFVLLALTGFPMKFAAEHWAQWVIGWFGGLQAARLLHHWAGVALIVGFVGYLVHIGWIVTIRAREGKPVGGRSGLVKTIASLPMWINTEDVRKLWHLLGYLVFLRAHRPHFGRFSLKEKFEYLGVFWGTVLLGVTGLLLWGEQITSHLLGGRAFNVAAIAHTYEAFLAVIHVGILHIYSVILSPHVFPFSPATITGQTPEVELAEGHSEFVQQVADELRFKAGEESYGE